MYDKIEQLKILLTGYGMLPFENEGVKNCNGLTGI